MNQWIKIATAVLCVFVALAFMFRKQGARAYHHTIDQNHQLVMVCCASLERALGDLKKHKLSSEMQELKESIRNELARRGMGTNDADDLINGAIESQGDGTIASSRTLNKIYKELKQQVEKSLDEVSQMKDFKTDSQYREAAIRWFQGYLELVEDEYHHLIEILKTPYSQANRFIEGHYHSILNELKEKKASLEKDLSDAAQAFSRQFKFKI